MTAHYQKLLDKLGLEIKDKELLETAFIHKSFVNEQHGKKLTHNERLEFLGDAVLELVVTEYLFKTYPDTQEGDLTNWRASLVKTNHLADVSKDLKLGTYLKLSRGEELSGGREKSHLLANVIEAFIGVIFIDRGYRVAHKFIEEHILVHLDRILAKGLHHDGKSLFQEFSQERSGITPHYRVLEEHGPDHSKKFIVGAYLGAELIAKGEGASKQKAEESAATNAIRVKKWRVGKAKQKQ